MFRSWSCYCSNLHSECFNNDEGWLTVALMTDCVRLIKRKKIEVEIYSSQVA